ncbi:hypothetical protein V757_04725 [Pelistega indica]|uniref:Branched-chain amino acid transporter AzlD family protein 2 n=1 Tax=Pelistega indica TaxID=1414851 RepID=V8G9G7_9BURK|nr:MULTISPECIES: AzlD domain-containing protein [Pelistega]ETD72352.1 hypothetical protein V757_04725 [Pelistega indica]
MADFQTWHLVVGIALMAILTYLTRSLPFVLMKKSKAFNRLGSGRFAILGPALLASTTSIILFSEVNKAIDGHEILPYGLAVVGVVVTLKLSKNIGLAMLIGLCVYGLGLNYL